MESVTLRLDLTQWAGEDHRPGIEDVEFRTPRRSDISRLGALYFSSYEPGVPGADLEEATADIAAVYDGLYGVFWPDASAVAIADETIVGSLLTVEEAPWDDTPPGPFIVELFVDRAHRRRGIARQLMHRCLAALQSGGSTAVGLRVVADNQPARDLYSSLGFVPWP